MKKKTTAVAVTAALFAGCDAFFSVPASVFPAVARAADPPRGDSDLSLDDRFELRLGSNARWLVDQEKGAISAWNLTSDEPLWTRDGVVYRAFQRPNNVIACFKEAIKSRRVEPAREIFGRVYFILDAVERTPFSPSPVRRRGATLVALDARNQGRLVWSRQADEFLRFFSETPETAPGSNARFVESPQRDAQDAIHVQVQRGQDVKTFFLDAASGDTIISR